MKYHFLFLFVFSILSGKTLAQFNLERSWGTYFGDEKTLYKDSTIDSEGNLYIVGKIRDIDNIPLHSFTTNGSHQPNFGGGSSDGFLVKFNPEGQLVWGTYFGGENYDAIEAIAIDSNNFIYITGSTQSTTNIATSNAQQTTLNHLIDIFIAKFNTSGTQIWASYLGGDGLNGAIDSQHEAWIFNGITVDASNNLYIFNLSGTSNLGTVGTFQPTRNGSKYLLSKFNGNGNRVWSTYYGINDSTIESITLTDTGIIVGGRTSDLPPGIPNTYFATPGCHQPTPGNPTDSYLTKFSFNGERLWSTYYGGNGTVCWSSRRGTLKGYHDAIYFASWTSANNNITTPGAFQETKTGFTHFLVKFNDNGERVWGTYYGLNQESGAYYNEMTSFLTFDNAGNPILSGSTLSNNNIATPGSYKETIGYLRSDSFMAKFTPDGQRSWGTYYGGDFGDYFGKAHFFNGSYYLVGSTANTTNIATSNAHQSEYISNGFDVNSRPANIYLAKFSPNPLSTAAFEERNVTLYPNPNHGSFYLSFPEQFSKVSLRILDALGKCVHTENDIRNRTLVRTDSLAKGMYFVAVSHEKNTVMKKIIVN